jgi:hypothetical protein
MNIKAQMETLTKTKQKKAKNPNGIGTIVNMRAVLR